MRNIFIGVFCLSFSVSAFAAGESAQDALSRAKALMFSDPVTGASIMAEADPAGMSGQHFAAEYELVDAYLAFKTSDEPWKHKQDLRRAIKRFESSGAPQTYEYGRILVTLSQFQIEGGSADYAERTAARALAIIEDTRPQDIDGRSDALVWGAAASLFSDQIFTQTITDAFEKFQTAKELFAPPSDIRSARQPYLTAFAWQAAAAGMIASRDDPDAPLSQFASAFAIEGGATDLPDQTCSGFWSATPERVSRRSREQSANLIEVTSSGPESIGPRAFVVLVDADDAGAAVNVRILSEARRPTTRRESKLGAKRVAQALADGLQRWRLDIDAAPAECRKDHPLIFASYGPAVTMPVDTLSRAINDLSR